MNNIEEIRKYLTVKAKECYAELSEAEKETLGISIPERFKDVDSAIHALNKMGYSITIKIY